MLFTVLDKKTNKEVGYSNSASDFLVWTKDKFEWVSTTMFVVPDKDLQFAYLTT